MGGGAEQALLRIALVTETYPPEINGVANTMRHLVEGLEGRGHGIQVVRPRQRHEGRGGARSPHDETLVPGLAIPRYRGLRFGLPVYRRLRGSWRSHRPDAVYIATQGPLGHAALSAARALDVPALTGFHTRFDQYSSHYGLRLLSGAIVGALRRFHNRSDVTLVPTPALRERLKGLGFRNLQLLSRGVDTRLFHPDRRSDALRASWGCPPAGPVLLVVGRLASEKNLDLALRAFDGVAARYPATRMVLVGDGPETERLRRSFPGLMLTGPKVGVELAQHYASGDLFLFPSLTETFGNVVLEAMASGLPVIAYDYAAANTCIRDGENGFRVPLGNEDAFIDAALTAVADPARLGDVSKRARATAERMSWGSVVSDLEERIREEIRGRKQDAENRLAATSE